MFNKNLTNPDFLIIGTQKGGTSSLYSHLCNHPNVMNLKMPKKGVSCPFYSKELHFFNKQKRFRKGLNYYKKHFPTKEERKVLSDKLNSKVISGESTPIYMYKDVCFKRISKHLSDTKLIMLLRNPVYRAYSQYKMEVKNGYEKLTFQEAILKEASRLDNKNKFIDKKNEVTYEDCYSYLSRGRYIEQLEKWYSAYPKENILVIKSEDLFTSQKLVFNQVCNFLEIPEFELKNYGVQNQGNDSSYQDLDPSIKDFLRDYFEPYNHKLHEFLDRDFNWYNEV